MQAHRDPEIWQVVPGLVSTEDLPFGFRINPSSCLRLPYCNDACCCLPLERRKMSGNENIKCRRVSQNPPSREMGGARTYSLDRILKSWEHRLIPGAGIREKNRKSCETLDPEK